MKKILIFLVCFTMLICIGENTFALEKRDAFIHSTDALFMNMTGYSSETLSKEFIRDVTIDPDWGWVITYTYCGPYEKNFSELYNGYSFDVGSKYNVFSFYTLKKASIKLSKCDLEHPDQHEWDLFLADLQFIRALEEQWQIVQRIRIQDGWNQKLGTIWQFWSYDEILTFVDQYGYHPSGLFDHDDPPRPSASDMGVDEAKQKAIYQLYKFAPNFSEETHQCWEKYLAKASCLINHEEQLHPAWELLFYYPDGDSFICDYVVIVCCSCHDVIEIEDQIVSIINSDSIEYPSLP